MDACRNEERKKKVLASGMPERDTQLHLGRLPGEMMPERSKELAGVSPDRRVVF